MKENKKPKTSLDSKAVCLEIKENQSTSAAADVMKNACLVLTHNIASGRPTLRLLRRGSLTGAGADVEIASNFTELPDAVFQLEPLLRALEKRKIQTLISL